MEYFMNMARLEGKKALPKCLPNPPVGSIIVKNGVVVARGHTNEPGKAHAEAMALSQMPSEEGDYILFATLEPCSFHGRTPSCAKAITKSKVKMVCIGMLDSDPRNNGKGIEILEKAGIKTYTGILENEIKADLMPYLIKG